MDGVLLDSECIYFECWKRAARHFGYEMSDDVAHAIRSCCSVYAGPYLKRVFGDDFDYIMVRDYRRKLVDTYLRENGVSIKKGARELLLHCKERGIITAVATATPRDVAVERLESVGLTGLFAHIIGGDGVSVGKPNGEIYRLAARTIGLETTQCFAVEDSPNGVASAFSAGCACIFVPDLTVAEESIKPLLYAVVDDLTAIIPLIDAVGEAKSNV